MVKCPRCGYENSPNAVYCDNCAYLLSDSEGNKINMVKRESSWNMGIGKKNCNGVGDYCNRIFIILCCL